MTEAAGALRQEEPVEEFSSKPVKEEKVEEERGEGYVAAPEPRFGAENSVVRIRATKRLGRVLGLIQSGGRIHGRRGYIESSLPEEDLFWLYRVAEHFLTDECAIWVHHDTMRPYRNANIAGDSPTDKETEWLDYRDSLVPKPKPKPKTIEEKKEDVAKERAEAAKELKKYLKDLGFWKRLRYFLGS